MTVDPTTGSVILRIVVPESRRHSPAGHVRPGGGRRKASTSRPSSIPQQAVSRDPKGNPIALIVDAEGKVRARGCSRLDRAIGDQWLVSSGLAPGDRVIVEGMQKVARPALPSRRSRLKPAPRGEAEGTAQTTP